MRKVEMGKIKERKKMEAQEQALMEVEENNMREFIHWEEEQEKQRILEQQREQQRLEQLERERQQAIKEKER